MLCYELTQVAHATGAHYYRSCFTSCVTSLYKLLMLLVTIIADAMSQVDTSISCYWWSLLQKPCNEFTQVAHATGDYICWSYVPIYTSYSWYWWSLLRNLCYDLTRVAHATGDHYCRNRVTSLPKLLMLLVLIIAEAVWRVYTSCSCYWWSYLLKLCNDLYKLPMLLVINVPEPV